MIRDGAIEQGMIPKVQACLETLGKGVRKIHIIDGRQRHALMLEIYTNKGSAPKSSRIATETSEREPCRRPARTRPTGRVMLF